MPSGGAGYHVPTEHRAGGLTWIECSCRWVSAAYLDAIKASAVWALHAAEEDPGGTEDYVDSGICDG